MDADNRAADEPVLYSARLAPHRSLSRRGRRRVLLAVAAFGCAASISFYLIGAWPVIGFLGLDVAIVWLAFRANDRSARAYEELGVSHVELSLRKVSPTGEARSWRFNPSWARLKAERHDEFGIERLAIEERGRRVEIGGFLGAEAKEEVSRSLGAALGQAKKGRVFNP